jgi:glycosyltransferase involved in cell wall biosynthesis
MNSITVIIPVHNGANYLAEAIASVQAQTCPAHEIVVVDDGSTDDSAAIAMRFGSPVQVISQAQAGSSAARNCGVENATGSLLAFLDADDLWLPDKLERQTRMLIENHSLEAVLGLVENFISPELDADVQRQLICSSEPMSGIHIGTLLIHRDAFWRVGLLDTRYQVGDFMDWWARAQEASLVYHVLPHVLMRRRFHLNNMTRIEHDAQRAYLPILKAMLERRRPRPVT